MALNVYLNKLDIPKDMRVIRLNDVTFNLALYKGFSVTEDVKKIIKKIDDAEYLQGIDIRSRYGNITSLENLSTGCKTLINVVAYPESVVSCEECGNNVLQEIFKLKKGNIFLSALPSGLEQPIDVNLHFDKKTVHFDDMVSFANYCEINGL